MWRETDYGLDCRHSVLLPSCHGHFYRIRTSVKSEGRPREKPCPEEPDRNF